MTPEGKVKEAVKKALKAYGAYYHMPVQNGMGAPSLDFVGCYCGKYFAIETKAPGKAPTPRQHVTMDKIYNAGGTIFIVDDATENNADLKNGTLPNSLSRLYLWLEIGRRKDGFKDLDAAMEKIKNRLQQ